MVSFKKQNRIIIASYWRVFRLIFVIFSFYLVGDALYRWNGFKYYATFSEFLPSVALVSILWSIIAILISFFVWLSIRVTSFFYLHIKWHNAQRLFLFVYFLVSLGAIIFIIKQFARFAWSDVPIPPNIKLIICLVWTLAAIFLTVAIERFNQWIEIIQRQITIWVWLFGIFVLCSLPIVAYHTWWGKTVKAISHEIDRFDVSGIDKPNIILVTFDALTAKDMSVYGYHRETTPFISEWAKTATVFTKCEAASTATYTSVPSLMMGKRVWTHRKYHPDAGKPAKIDIESFPLLLKNSGYHNMSFTANDMAAAENLGTFDSFDVKPSFIEMFEPVTLNGILWQNLFKYFGGRILLYDWIVKEDFILNILLPNDFFKYPYKNEYPVEKVFDRFLSEINNNYQGPFFVWMHLNPPHAPYLPPKQYVGMFDTSPKFRTAKSQFDLINPRYYTPEQQADVDIVRNRYDEFIRYCDKGFEYFIEQLSLKNNLKNTVIILSSDHGESFEHGVCRHGSPTSIFEEMTHIPLIIKESDQNEGRIIDFPVSHIDIPATILDLAHISVPPWMEGHSLTPLLRGKELQPSPVYSMDLKAVPARGQAEINKGIVAVWEGDYKLIHNIATKENLLFNLKLDPNELNNLFLTEIEVGQHLLGLIRGNLEKANERIRREK